MKAFLVDDNCVISGTYRRHRFTPNANNFGFHYQTISESDLGKILFFDESIANAIAEKGSDTLKPYLITLKTDKFHDDYRKIIYATCPKEALDNIADDLSSKRAVGVFSIYNILEEYNTDTVEQYFKQENIIKVGSEDTYVALIELFEFNGGI